MAVMEALLKIRADVTGEHAVDKLGSALHRVGNQGTTAMNRIKTATSGAFGVVRTFLPALGAVGLVKLAKDGIDSADAMSKLSQRTGIAAPTLDKFRKVAELSDTSIETLGKAFPALASNIQKASQGSGPAADAFKQLGISMTDASGNLRSTDDVMLEIADRFKQMEDGTEKAALASDIFGRRLGSELIPMLNSGGDAVREMSTALTQDFADKSAVFNDRLENIGERIQALGTAVVRHLLPYIDKLVAGFEAAVIAFDGLPQPVQAIIVAIGSLATAFALLAPIITPLIGLLSGLMSGLAALKIGATIAGWAGAIGPAMTAISAAFTGLLGFLTGTVLPALLAFFSGPAGWTVLAVAAVVAMAVAFREPIMDFLSWVGSAFMEGIKALWSWTEPARQAILEFVRTSFQVAYAIIDTLFIQPWINIWNNLLRKPVTAMLDWLSGIWQGVSKAFTTYVIEPMQKAWNALVELIPNAMRKAAEFVQGVWTGMVNAVKNVLRGVLQSVANSINAVGAQINRLIRAFNALPGADIPTIPTVSVPAFAAGGVVNQPTLAMVGEAEREYIVPESKMAAAAANYLSGARGGAVIPAFANGGTAGAAAGGGAANTTVQITTGPVLQQDGQRYVTIGDLERALQDYGAQIFRNSRSYGGRRYQGAY